MPRFSSPPRRPPGVSRSRRHGELGMSTAEYALGTVAACAFAAVLYMILTGSRVRDVLTDMVTTALRQVGG
ncbi:hypothetical protein GCM10027294_08870 [Marinactinospora endophytica]|uniref:DUF4244 domain-containing protein n=1 Tax=Marinactinospora thermotolerans TaxID=531310 RepID=UPI00228659E1|nr:DUF4244 domain-containing protein [Marinactinospora thermotolerans]